MLDKALMGLGLQISTPVWGVKCGCIKHLKKKEGCLLAGSVHEATQ